MTREHRVLGVDLAADRLGDAEHDSAGERGPQRGAQAADHDRLEGEDQVARPGVRGEARADREEHPADRGDRHGDRRRARVDGARVDADQLGGVRILSGRPHLAPGAGSREERLQAAVDHDRDAEGERADRRDRQLARDLPARRRDRSGLRAERAVVDREALIQQVLDHDRETERRQQRHEQPRSQAALEQDSLQHVADQQHHRQHRQDREERRRVPVLEQQVDQIRAEHGEVAVGEVDDSHQPEHQRQPAREQPVEPAEHDALNDGVDPGHASTPWGRLRPKYASVICSRVNSRLAPLEHELPLQHADDALGDARRAVEVLLDEHDRRALGDHGRERLVDGVDGLGSEAERDLVEQQQTRIGDQRSADRGRLLLAAGQRRRPLMAQAGEHREGLDHALHGPAARAAWAARRRAGSPRPSTRGRAAAPRAPARCPSGPADGPGRA